MTIEQKIESILFALGEPLSIKQLSDLTGESKDVIVEAITRLRESLAGRGIILVESHEGFTLGTHPDATEMLNVIRKDELGKELSKASLETLAIILYHNGASRSDIDYIRGVNSTFILRNLVLRGLIERTEHPDDSRKALYVPSLDLLTHMGISTVVDLPDYESVSAMFRNRSTQAEVIADTAEIA